MSKRDLRLEYQKQPGTHRVYVLFASGRGIFFTFSNHETARNTEHILRQIQGKDAIADFVTPTHTHKVYGKNIDVISLES